jgi:uncharacterized protein with HEPN domain
MRNQGLYLKDIIEYANKTIEFTKDMTIEQFENDSKTYLATIRCIEVIGEAARNLDDETKNKYPEYPGNILQICGMF